MKIISTEFYDLFSITAIYTITPKYGTKKWRKCLSQNLNKSKNDIELFREIDRIILLNDELVNSSKKDGNKLWVSIKNRKTKN